MVKYGSLSFPLELREQIENLLKDHPELGYASVSEFLKDAVRDKLIKLKSMKK